jgi:integrase
VTDLDGADPTLTIPRERYKQGRNQEVPLSSLAVDILADAPRWRGPFVLSTTGGEKPSSNYGKNKTKLDEKMLAHLREVDPDAELTPWRLHDLRRTVGTNLARLGVPVHTISRVLGHAQGGVTAIYDRHSYAPEKRDALERWATKLRAIVDDQVVDLATERGRRA